jgi:hypothetical protein
MSVLNTIAMWLGYAVMVTVSVWLIYATSRISLRGNPSSVIVLGFSPVWFDAEQNYGLYNNTIKVGYRLARIGRLAVGFNMPRWLSRLTV